MEKVYVFGHKKPDTDAVTSAIALAYLKRMQGVEAEARVLGRLNYETKFVLKYFNIKYPEFLNDVKIQVQDVNYNKTKVIDTDSIKNCYDKLIENKLNGCPVVNTNNKLCGIVTLNDIASYLIDTNHSIINTSYNNLVNVLDGTEILKKCDEISGNIIILSGGRINFLQNVSISSNTIVITEEMDDVLDTLIDLGLKNIVLVNNSYVDYFKIQNLSSKNINIIRTKNDMLTVTKKIYLSNYVKEIMTTDDIIKFNKKDYLNDFIGVDKQTNHHIYPVVDKNDNCLGLLRLVDLVNKNKKKVILVDHNEINQSVDGIEDAEILEIIDHHKLGFLKTDYPINFRNMSVGSTNTIIYKMFEENNILIPREIAGIMLSGIISDTLLLKSPTTTVLDKVAVVELSNIAGIDYEQYGIEMFKAGSSIKGKSLEEILFNDFKVFKVGNIECGIGQIFTTNYNELKLNNSSMINLLNTVSNNHNYLVTCLFITDVMENGSYVLYNELSGSILKDSFDLRTIEEGMYLDKIVSRKKQILPAIISVLEKK